MQNQKESSNSTEVNVENRGTTFKNPKDLLELSENVIIILASVF
jgi:hypothetical protein